MIGGNDLRKLIKFSILCLLYILSVNPCNSAVITTSTGEPVEISNITYKDGQFYFKNASETVTIDRREIRDISFTAKTQKKEISSSDAGDLPDYMEKAQNLHAKYPDANSIIVFSEKNHSHRHDNTNIFRYRCIVYVAKDEAIGVAHVSIPFAPDREKVKIIHARALGPDGEVHNLTPEQIKISKDSSGSVHFSNDQSMSFTIPEVTVGSLVDYSYEAEEFNPYDANLFSGRSYFQSSSPIGETILKVSVPNNHELYYTGKNLPESLQNPTKIEAIDSILYTWKTEDIAPIIGEPNMPPFREVVPCVYYSLQKDHTYQHEKLKPMYEKRFELTDDVKAKVDELVKDCKHTNEKIAKLYYFCQQEIRYISIKSNMASNQVGHPADETLKNKYGDCTDKGLLLAVMLKHIGVEAYPVLILTNDSGKSVREIGIFDDNHCITEVHQDGRIFYLDATATDYRYPYFRPDDHGVNAMNVMLGTQRQVPLPPPEDNASISVRKIKVERDGTTHIDVENTCNGPTEAAMRNYARNLKPEEYEKLVRRGISTQTADYVLEIATHTNPLDFDTQFKSHSAYTLNRYATKSGRYMIFPVPYFELGSGEVSLEKRNFAIQHRTSSQSTEQINIKLPEGYTVKYLPPALRVQSPYVEFEVIYDQQGDEINITRKMASPLREIPVADYPSYKADLEKIAHSSKQKIFLEDISNEKKAVQEDATASDTVNASDTVATPETIDVLETVDEKNEPAVSENGTDTAEITSADTASGTVANDKINEGAQK